MSIEKLRELVRWAKDNGGMREWALADDCFEWALHIESNGVAQTDECSKLRARVAELEKLIPDAARTIEGMLPPGDESLGIPEFPSVSPSAAWEVRCKLRDALALRAPKPETKPEREYPDDKNVQDMRREREARVVKDCALCCVGHDGHVPEGAPHCYCVCHSPRRR